MDHDLIYHRGLLLHEVDAFLERTGMGSTYLGLAAANNGHCVARLRRGGDIKWGTVHKLREFMSGYTGRRPRSDKGIPRKKA